MMRNICRTVMSVTFISGLVAVIPLPTYASVNSSMWRSNNIIDDSIFADSSAMSVSEIDLFLKKLLPSCDRWGTKKSEYGGGTRAQFAKTAYGVDAPFTCLTEYYEVPKTNPSTDIPVNNYGKFNQDGSPYKPTGSISVPQIIYNSAQKYQISPRALIIKLATESPGPLTRDEWPMPNQYYYAMGAHCPDDGPNGSANCRKEWSGFSLQMDEAANLLRGYLDNMDQAWWPYKRVGNGVDRPISIKAQDLCSERYGVQNSNCVGWNVPSSCRGTVINIQSKATAALYTYTPYQPNQAALNNMYGQGDSCSSYGNRNFWRVWNDWFGSTQRFDFVSLDYPRWMQIKSNAYKVDIVTGKRMSDNLLVAGRQIYFSDKVYLNGVWYLRTTYDKSVNNLQGIPISELMDIEYVDLPTPVWKSVANPANKSVPSQRSYYENLTYGTTIKFVQKITVNGATYYRTEHDKNVNNNLGVIESQLTDPRYVSFDIPTVFTTKQNTAILNPITSQQGSGVANGTAMIFNKKILINGQWYYQPEAENSGLLSINSNDLIRPTLVKFKKPVVVRLNKTTDKYNLHTLKKMEQPSFTSGLNITIVGSINIGGVVYYQTSYDLENGNHQGFLLNDLLEDLPQIVSKTTTKAGYKQFLESLENNDHYLSVGQTISFSQRILIDNVWYYRTSYDKSVGNYLCVNSNILQ